MMILFNPICFYLKTVWQAAYRIAYCGVREKIMTHSAIRNTRHAPHATRHVPVLLLYLLLLLIFLASPTLAQTIDAKVNFYIDAPDEQTSFTVGDQIPLRLEIVHPANSQASLPDVPQEWEGFEVISQSEPATVNNGDGTATTGKEIVVSLFEPGSYQTPRLVVSHYQADGSVEDLGAPVIPIKIESVLVEGDEELRDLKPQAELPLPPIWPWVLGGVLVTLLTVGLLAGTALWLYHRRKRQEFIPQPAMPVIDPRPPEVIAYAELDRIEALNLPAKNQFKEHYSLLTNCLRRYIEDRYHLPALERTTGEIQASFSITAIPKEVVREFMSIFWESDFVKFARYRPATQDAYHLLHRARELVAITTPQPEPAAEQPARPEPEVMK